MTINDFLSEKLGSEYRPFAMPNPTPATSYRVVDNHPNSTREYFYVMDKGGGAWSKAASNHKLGLVFGLRSVGHFAVCLGNAHIEHLLIEGQRGKGLAYKYPFTKTRNEFLKHMRANREDLLAHVIECIERVDYGSGEWELVNQSLLSPLFKDKAALSVGHRHIHHSLGGEHEQASFREFSNMMSRIHIDSSITLANTETAWVQPYIEDGQIAGISGLILWTLPATYGKVLSHKERFSSRYEHLTNVVRDLPTTRSKHAASRSVRTKMASKVLLDNMFPDLSARTVAVRFIRRWGKSAEFLFIPPTSNSVEHGVTSNVYRKFIPDSFPVVATHMETLKTGHLGSSLTRVSYASDVLGFVTAEGMLRLIQLQYDSTDELILEQVLGAQMI